MDIMLREMRRADWDAVSRIYKDGIKTITATFQQEVPDYENWNQEHMKPCRFVAVNTKGIVVGWAALTPVSSRCVYRGVAEVSVYVTPHKKGVGIGTELLNKLVEASEQSDIWTLQSSIISSNMASIRLHEKCGFRLIGYREKIAKDASGNWQNIVLFERRTRSATNSDSC